VTGARKLLRVPALVAALGAVVLTGVGADAAAPPSYREEVFADSPAAYWRLGEGSGTVALDETANDSRGTYKNGVVLGVPSALATDANTAARFDGGNDLVDVTDPPSGVLDFGTDDFTAEAWIKTTTNNETAIIGKRVTAGPFWQVTVTDDPNHTGQLRANLRDTLNGTVTRQVYSTRRVDDGAWHHVVVRFDRDVGISIYVDARAAGSGGGPMPADVSNTANLQIGKAQDHGYFRGDIDEVAVYRTLLSPQRINDHFHASTLDDVAPQVTLDRPADGSSTNDSTPGFEGSAGGEIGDVPSVTVEVYSGTDVTAPPVRSVQGQRAGDGSFTAETPTALQPGAYTARATQLDRANNAGLSNTTTFTVAEGATSLPAPPTIAAAGDMTSCGGTTSGEFLTAALVEGLPDATVLTLGDNAYPNGTATEFANCYDPTWGRFKSRTKPAPGGHDYNTPGAAGYYGYFGAAAGDPAKGYYSYDLGSWHVITLNAVCDKVSCNAGDPQEQWLRQDLAAHPTSCTLAVIHEPRFSSGAVHGGTTDVQPFWEALYEHGAEFVLSGDDHLYERFLPQTPDGQLDTARGIAQFVVGTGGFYLYDFAQTWDNSVFRDNSSYGVIKMTLRAGSYDWKFLRTDGGIRDVGSANCHGTGTEPPPDTTAPETTLDSGPSGITASASASFSFSTNESGADFQCRLDAGAWTACSSPKTYAALADGTHAFDVRAKDAAGNVDLTPETRTWTVDTTAPDTTIDSGPSGTTTSIAASFAFSASEPGATFECRLDDGGWASCSSPKNHADLGDGSHTFEVRATDGAGHVDPSPAARTWTIDATGAETTIDAGPSGTTSSRDASFTFSSEPGATFECRLDGSSWTTCSAPAEYVGLADGSHTFAVRAIDSGGNVDPTPAGRSWTVDATAPETTIDSGPSGTTALTSATFTFSASGADPDATLECRLDAGLWTPCSSPANYTDLADGSHAFEVRATDTAGNIDPTPASRVWVVDTTPPPDTTPPDTTIVLGTSGPTSSTTAGFSFSSSEVGSTFECRREGGAWAACGSPTSYADVAEGDHSFEVRATDAAGNVDPTPASRSWSVDVTAPDTAIASGPAGNVPASTATLTFSSPEAGSMFECRLDAGAWTACASPKEFAALADGNHTFEVRAIDAAGNVDATPATRAWTVDTTAPDTTLLAGPSGITSATTASFSFSSEAGASFQCRLGGSAWTSCTSPMSYQGLTDGPHTFEVRATDAAGNVDATPAARTWTVDATPPNTTITAGPSGTANAGSATFSFASTEAGSTFQCRLNGSAWAACTSPTTYSGLAKRTHTFDVRATDAAGNTDPTPASRTWTRGK
jgi:hypothetical protein